jgi:hypothetical protein
VSFRRHSVPFDDFTLFFTAHPSRDNYSLKPNIEAQFSHLVRDIFDSSLSLQ